MLAGKLFHGNVVVPFLNILVNCIWLNSITQTYQCLRQIHVQAIRKFVHYILNADFFSVCKLIHAHSDCLVYSVELLVLLSC